jgi:7-cyano-7-deazaguanine tRNA-ribosyltransferase
MIEFEIRDRDLLARVGRLRTKSGTIETPVFLPVINMAKQSVAPRELWTDFECKMLMTNAYIVKKQQGESAKKEGVHALLDFPGVVMTDSGAYQILAYGNVDITPEEIVRFQEGICTDIATILDLPTGWKVSKEHAQYTVEETLRRAKDLEGLKTHGDIGWIGPVQGGRYLDLVAASARQMGKLPFDLHALGSPTPVMEQYLFDLLVDMVLTAKMNLPHGRPFHLFGAGHPFMFALAVALGCDLFDSAAYSIFAKEDRYLTEHGTVRLENLEYLPCSCSVCARRAPEDLVDMSKDERERELAKHNLYVSFSEMRRIKQAIVEGRLWEHLEIRSHGHPALLQALKRLGKYAEYIERHSPVVKRSGLFFFSSVGLVRPEVTRYRKRLLERYTQPEGVKVLLLAPSFGRRHIRISRRYRRTLQFTCEKLGIEKSDIHVCVYDPPFGVVPAELADIYPLSHYEIASPPDLEMIEYVAERIVEYVESMHYRRTVMLTKKGTWMEKVAQLCNRICEAKDLVVEELPLRSDQHVASGIIKNVQKKT